jgi:single-stranded DNA-binding protein
MKNIAEFQIIGRVGTMKTVGPTLRVSVCANYGAKDDAGEWQEQPYWNEVTIFQDSIKGWVQEHVSKGDLVFARGRIRQGRYSKDGIERFAVDLNCDEFSRLARASDPGE